MERQMSSDAKEPGQRAYEAYVTALGDNPSKTWPTGDAPYKAAWAAVEQSLTGPSTPAAKAGDGWITVELAPLVGVLAYLNAEVGQYPHPRAAPSRIRRAMELLQAAIPAPPSPETNGDR